jgi:hypothetical protein
MANMAPHTVKRTLTVNKARTMIYRLNQPLADITKNIQSNIEVLKCHGLEVQKAGASGDVQALKKNLYIPINDLIITKLKRPVTVCTDTGCAEVVELRGQLECNYTQKCHNPCYLRNVEREKVDNPLLFYCYAMTEGLCRECGCDYRKHMHIYYSQEVVEAQVVDPSIQEKLDLLKDAVKNQKSAKKQAKHMTKFLEDRRQALRQEQEIITRITAEFAAFLKNYAILPFNDSFENYVQHLLKNEEDLSKNGSQNKEVIEGLNHMLTEYKERLHVLKEAMGSPRADQGVLITPEKIEEYIQELYRLEMYGEKIRLSFEAQSGVKNEVEAKERQILHEPKPKRTPFWRKWFTRKTL